LAALAGSVFVFAAPAWVHAADRPASNAAQAEKRHDMAAHAMPTTTVASLGLADFERMALEHNPTLQQAAAQFQGALHRSYQAGLYPNPTLGYVQEQIGALGESQPTSRGVVPRGRSSPGDLVGGFVQQQIVTGGKLRLSRAKFAEEATAARWQIEVQQFRVLNGIRIRYFEVLAAQRLIDIHRELVRLNDDAVRTTEQLVNVGQANQPDLLQAQVEGHRARVALRHAQNRYRGNWEHLVALVGVPELRPVALDTGPLEAEAAPLDFEATLDRLVQCSPEIQAALAEIRRDQIMVQRERVEPIPNLTVQAVTGYNYEFGITTAGVQLSFPLPVFNRNQGTIAEAQADLARDHAEYRRVVLSLRQRLADAETRYNDALQSMQDFRTRSLPLARRAYETQLDNFRARRAAWPQVLVAQRTHAQFNQEYVEALLELRRAEVEIGGMLLVDGLSTPPSPTSQGHIESVPTPR
jgi:cobalt-zinc-cadmium efflux system outer membrane protein